MSFNELQSTVAEWEHLGGIGFLITLGVGFSDFSSPIESFFTSHSS